MNIINPDYVFNAILMLACIGVLLFIWALGTLMSQFRALRNFKPSECIPQKASDDAYRVRLAVYLYGDTLKDLNKELSYSRQWSWIKQRLNDAIKGENEDRPFRPYEVGKGSHLKLRLQSLYRALADENGSRELPSLGDLHQLTLRDELSRFAPSWLSTIVSFLLIAGILGTLCGIHSAVENNATFTGGLDLKSLTPALEPSMLAVFCTVVLMWLRGIYIAVLNRFLHAFDELTMTELIPSLQPQININIEAADKGRGEHNNFGALREAAEQMERLAKELGDSIGKQGEIANRISALDKPIDELTRKLGDTKAWKQVLDEDDRCFQETQQQLNKMSSYGLALNEKIDGLTLAMSGLREEFSSLTEVSLSTAERLKTDVVFVEELARKSTGLATYAAALRQCDEKLGEITGYADLIDHLADSVEQSRALVQQKAGDAERVAVNTEQCVRHAEEFIRSVGVEVGNYERKVNDQKGILSDARSEVVKKGEEMKKALEDLSSKINDRKNSLSGDI